ncbi:NAD-dependent epimerase/dehydratase family protein [Dactylosporangium sp. CA-233914]|uniref:NAD-dependent epimerase/dehydratase family protein n=1 Tax=Dactylosporangium sp. CA-233914 TaxID=3239934 RepID=UPI003D8FA12A
MTGPAGPLRVAVLGATGCLGGQITAAAKEAGHHVLGVARRTPAGTAADTFVAVDVTDPALGGILAGERVDVVVNAVAGWGRSPAEAHAGNVEPVDRLLECLRALDPVPRLVHLGTIHEYGPVPEGLSIVEDTSERPESTYATAKLAASRRVLTAIRDGEVRGAVLRVANTYGPNPSPVGFLGSLVRRLAALAPHERIDITVAGDRRDYVDVRDVARAVVLAVRFPAADPLVNIGSGEATSLRTIVRALVAATGLRPEAVVEHEERVESLGGSWTRFDITRARDRLGWRPQYTLVESMRAMWAGAAAVSADL